MKKKSWADTKFDAVICWLFFAFLWFLDHFVKVSETERRVICWIIPFVLAYGVIKIIYLLVYNRRKKNSSDAKSHQ